VIYAVISDVHANEAALRKVLEDAASQGAQCVVCLGDTVGYGPAPAAAVALVRKCCGVVLAGNHDDAVGGRMDAEGFVDVAGEAVARHRQELPPGDVKWLRSLPYVYEGDGFVAAHGDFVEPEKFYYVEDEEDARANFGKTGAQLMFVGHTHVPKLCLTGESGRVYVTDAQDFTMEKGKRYIVNPGSVGYPRERDGKCVSTYVLYDSGEKTVVFRSLPFSIATVLQRGAGRRPGRLAFWAAIAAALAVVTAATVAAFRRAPEVSAAVEAGDAGLIVDSVTLDVGEARKVSANLKLSRTSAPLQLSVEFRTADGGRIGEERLTVRRSSAKRFTVPEGARSAVFTLKKNAAGDRPEIIAFGPARAD
jgi:predicted phosphodiesterase